MQWLINGSVVAIISCSNVSSKECNIHPDMHPDTYSSAHPNTHSDTDTHPIRTLIITV